jgi:hypothetical protein
MLQAQLRGKLTRKEEDLEDLLTSNVFGSMKYVPPEEGLLPLLASSSDSDGKAPVQSLQPISNVEYHFWPWIQEPKCQGCEPDVLITIRFMNNRKIVILVESKYRSGKSSGPSEEGAPMDQLAREWDNLIRLAEQENATPILLYVTDDIGYPKKSIEDSQQEYLQKRKKDIKVFWISWRKLPTLFSDKKQSILSDLVEVLRRQRLTFYEGTRRVEPINVKWSFKAMINWNWSSYRECNINWKYQVRKNYIWTYRIETAKWRFGK